ncbi:hypothetical protein AX17_001871 [Amanita inopinata Kibby_2008]|nr:hypothetical protein AX17_001871 [Amanita inopinata Kibby_2008]
MQKVLNYSRLEASSKWKRLNAPPGFVNVSTPITGPSRIVASDSYDKIKEKKAWDFAISPAKSLPMQAFMLYMSGGGVQVFSMSIVFMLLLTPLKSLAGVNSAFAPFAPSKSNPKSMSTLPLQKLVYFACNLLTIGVGLWKCRSMGLLPTGTGDWLAFEPRGVKPEISLY